MSDVAITVFGGMLVSLVGAIVFLVKQRQDIKRIQRSLPPPAPSDWDRPAGKSGEWPAMDQGPPSTRAAFESISDLGAEIKRQRRTIESLEEDIADLRRDLVSVRASLPPRAD